MQETGENRLKKIREALKKGKMCIEFAPQDKVVEFDYEVRLVLKTLGHPEALVTDESRIGDFLVFGTDDLDNEDSEASDLQEVSELLGIEVNGHDYIWEVAEKLATVN